MTIPACEALMRLNSTPVLIAVMLMLSCSVGAQEKTEQEIEIHKNVRLIIMAIPQEVPEELKDRYQGFLPLFEEALKENTSDQALENALTVRIVPGIKEIGAAKTKRVIVYVTIYRKNSNKEFIASFLLHNYATGENVSEKEIGQFLKKILIP
jgi:hypothetical protein